MLNYTIEELHEGYKNKEFSPVEVTKEYVKQIEKWNSTYNAYITPTLEMAMDQAEISEKKIMAGLDLGSVEGVPISYKDIIQTKNIRTTNGSKVDEKFISDDNAEIVKQLNAAGAITVGKANLYEYAAGITPENPYYGNVKNPINMKKSAGGSSSGSAAAVAAHLCTVSVGTDTAGSLRVPAACCGVVGLKPTYDLISRKRVMPLSFSLDHMGAITRNVLDAAAMLEALSLQSVKVNKMEELRGVRIGIPESFLQNGMESAMKAEFEETVKKLEAAGVVILEVKLPPLEEIMNTAKTIVTSEMSFIHAEKRKNSEELYGEAIRTSFENGDAVSAYSYIEALNNRERFSRKVSSLFKEVDIIVMPTMPVFPVNIEEEQVSLGNKQISVRDAFIHHTCLFNITGHPALTLPAMNSNNGMPMGLQIIAPYHEEQSLLSKAYVIEQHFLQRNDI